MPVFDDQSILDDRQTVEYVSRRDAGNVTASVSNAVSYGISKREVMASNGRYQSGDVVWTLPRSQVLALGPKVGDAVLAEGVKYTVIGQDISAFASFVKLTTRNLVIAYGLQQSVTILRPNHGLPTPTADRSPQFVSSGPFVAAVQEMGRSPAEFLERRANEVRYTIVLEAQAADLTHECLIVWNGLQLQIESVANVDRLDFLQQVECVYRGE